MRTIRQIMHLLVPAMGMALVLGAVLFGENVWIQLFLVVAGLLMTEAGFWRMAEPILPNERRFVALRAETDFFTRLVRQLNATALEHGSGKDGTEGFAMDEIGTEMHRSVDRMLEFAGKTEAEVPPEAAGPRRGSEQHSGAPVEA